MATMSQSRPRGRRRSRRAGLPYGLLGIGALAMGILVLTVFLRQQPGAPVTTVTEAPTSPTEHATKADNQPASNAGKAAAAKMSPAQWETLDELLVSQFKRCWTYKSRRSSKQYIPKIRVFFEPNGSLQANPALINTPDDPAAKALAASALDAVTRCKQVNIPATFGPFYDEWKTRIIYFDPNIMESLDASR